MVKQICFYPLLFIVRLSFISSNQHGEKMTYPEEQFVIAITQENVAETLWAQMWVCFRLPEIFVVQIFV